MPYIDSSFYLNTYKGLNAQTPDELDRTILRSCEVIDLLTNYLFVTGGLDFSTYNAILKLQVQKATAALVEHYILNGGYDAVKQSGNITGSSLGAFSYSGSSDVVQEVPEAVFALLYPTGLLYTGIGGCIQ